ncbi:MAG: hypothetical protein RL701_4941 [Pseudomonadota bacterium]
MQAVIRLPSERVFTLNRAPIQRWSALSRSAITIACFGLLSSLAGCSALIDVGGKQCESDDQCKLAKLGDRCVRHVCEGEVSSLTAGVAGTFTGRCTSDEQCMGEVPSCMRGTCVARDVAERFSCGGIEKPEPSNERVRYSFRVVEFVSHEPPHDLTGKACYFSDVECSSPISTSSAHDNDGMLEFEVPKGFVGYIEVKSPDVLNALSYRNKPVVEDTVDRELPVPSPKTVMLLATVGKVDADLSKGLALLEAFECNGNPAGGIHFTDVTGTGEPFYIVDHTPNRTVFETVYDKTNNVADGGFVNLEPGYVNFIASVGVDGPTLGEFNVTVRPETVTFVDMYF